MAKTGAPRPPSGPGKFSQRTDQPVQAPGLDAPDVQYGDVNRLRAAQKAVPLPNSGNAAGAAPGTAGVTPTSRAGGLPSFMFEGKSARPTEPGTSGLTSGAGPGPEILPSPAPDPREQTLTYLYQMFRDDNALAMLNKLRDERVAQQQSQAAPGVPAGPQAPALQEPL